MQSNHSTTPSIHSDPLAGMFKTVPFLSERPWGYELWTLSTHRNGQSLVLPQHEPLGHYLQESLPILIKTIQANEALSVQVHPDDAYARIHENDNGKTECWYILEAKPGAQLIAGIHEGVTREDMAAALEQGNLEALIEYIDVQAGDMIYIPAGTVHAILGGIKLLEIQQSSDSTYRMYDWGRDREMHIEKSLDVIDYQKKHPCGKIENFTKLETPYFNVEKQELNGTGSWKSEEMFHTINIIQGDGSVKSGQQDIPVQNGDTIYIPAHTSYSIQGDLSFLRTY